MRDHFGESEFTTFLPPVFLKIKRKFKFNIFTCKHRDSFCSAKLYDIYLFRHVIFPRNRGIPRFFEKIYYDFIFTIRWKMNRNTPYFFSHSLYCVVSMVSIYGGGRLVFASTFNQTYYYFNVWYNNEIRRYFLNKFKMMCLQNNIIIYLLADWLHFERWRLQFILK